MDISFLTDLIVTKVTLTSVIYGEKRSSSPNFCQDRKRWAIIIKYEGETEYISHDRTYLSNFQNIPLLPAGCAYRWTCKKAGHYAVIEFECNKKLPEIFSFPVTDGEKILRIFRDLDYYRTGADPLADIKCIHGVYEILLILTKGWQKNYTSSSHRQVLQKAVDYMISNYYMPICNDQLAEMTGFSTVYFRQLFHKTYGISPIMYLQNIRLQKAKELLKSDYDSISEIAHSLGYSSIYDFSRAFKKQTGMSPSQYAKSEKQR